MVTLDCAKAAGAARARAIAPRVNFMGCSFEKAEEEKGSEPGLCRHLNLFWRADCDVDSVELSNRRAVTASTQARQCIAKLMNLLSFAPFAPAFAWCDPRVTPN